MAMMIDYILFKGDYERFFLCGKEYYTRGWYQSGCVDIC